MIKHTCRNCGKIWFCNGSDECETLLKNGTLKEKEDLKTCVCPKCFYSDVKYCEPTSWRIA